MTRGDDFFKIIEKINGNAYKENLPSEYRVSAPFNAFNLSLFDVGDYLRLNPFLKKKGYDAI